MSGSEWNTVPFWSVARRVERTGRPEAQLLSVYREWGVIRKADRDDNFNQASEDLSSYKIVHPGDLVLNKMKTWQGSLGVSKYEGIVSPAYFVCELSKDVDGDFIHHLLRSRRYIADFMANSKGIRPNQWDLPYEALRQLPLRMPSMEEQRRIADFLDDRVARIDQIITARQQQAALEVVAHKRLIIDSLSNSSVRLLATAPWMLPDTMASSVKALGNCWAVIDCKHRTPQYVDAGHPVISPGDVRPGRLDLSRATRFVTDEDLADLADPLRRCIPGDIVYSRNASAGTASFVDTDVPFTMGQDVCRITSANQDQLYLTYVLNYLVEPQLESARIGSTITRINIAQIKALLVPVPSIEHQRSKAAECDQLTAEHTKMIQLLEKQVALLQEYKQSLITAAVTGEFDVTTASTRIPE